MMNDNVIYTPLIHSYLDGGMEQVRSDLVRFLVLDYGIHRDRLGIYEDEIWIPHPEVDLRIRITPLKKECRAEICVPEQYTLRMYRHLEVLMIRWKEYLRDQGVLPELSVSYRGYLRDIHRTYVGKITQLVG